MVQWVVTRARQVTFHRERVVEAVSRWGPMPASAPPWDHPCHYRDSSAETARCIFVMDVLNHCFWPGPGEVTWGVSYGGKVWSGYWGLAASLKRALEEGAMITRADCLEHISMESLEHIFRGEGRIPLLEQRLENLREAGRVLKREWGGDVLHLIEDARGSAVRLVEQVVESFPSFRDEAEYDGRRVCFWKRAQLFASDLYHAFNGGKWGAFSDLEALTAFADYKLPQVLRALGIISYERPLETAVDGLRWLGVGSPEEVEIRAMTIWAVEEIKKAFSRVGQPVTSAAVDHWLWQLGQSEPFRRKPYHRCRTIYY